MLTVSTQIGIAAPIEKIWDVLTDLPGYNHWNPYLNYSRGTLAQGETFSVIATSAAGDVTPLEVRAERVEPYEMIWIGGLEDLNLFRGEHWFVLTEKTDRVVLEHFEHFTGELADDILGRIRPAVEDNFSRMNSALKNYVEQGGNRVT